MANHPLDAAELLVVGLMVWLLYTQIGTSSKHRHETQDPLSHPLPPDEKP